MQRLRRMLISVIHVQSDFTEFLCKTMYHYFSYHKYTNINSQNYKYLYVRIQMYQTNYNLYEPPTAFSMNFLGINAIAS